MAQSKMTTDMAFSKLQETVRGLISEMMMCKSQAEKLHRDFMAGDEQLQSETDQLIQAFKDADLAEGLESKACVNTSSQCPSCRGQQQSGYAMDEELSSLRKSITQSSRAFENERQSWGETRTSLEDKVHALGEEMEQHIEMEQQSRAEVERLSSKVKSVEAQNRRMTADLENMTRALSTTKAAVELKTRECESLNQEQAKFWKDIQQKSEKTQDLEKENKTLETDTEFFMKLDDKQPTSTKGTRVDGCYRGFFRFWKKKY